MAALNTCILSVIAVLTLTTSTMKTDIVVGQCNCQKEVFCRNGCNCYELEPDNKKLCGVGYTYKCNGTAIYHVPGIFPERNVSNKLCVFELSNTTITKLQNSPFLNMGSNLKDIRLIDLAMNNISFIDSDAFSGLENVIVLNLTANNINHESFMDGAFIPLTGLQRLSLKKNSFKTFGDIDVHLSHLTQLKRLYIDGCVGCELGPGMQNLTNLRFLSFSGYESDACNLGTMSSTMFQYVPGITQLYVSHCNLPTEVNNLTFAPLKNIKLLDMSYNRDLKFEGMNRCLYGLRNSSTLNELNVNHIHESYERGTMLKMEHVENLKFLGKLTVLHMDLNKLEVLELGILHNRMLPASLKVVTLTGNRLTYGRYFDHLFMLDKIVYLDISRQHLYFDPFYHTHYGNEQYIPAPNHINRHLPVYHDDRRVANYNSDACLERHFKVFIVPKDLINWQWRMSFLYFDITEVTLVHVLSTTSYIPKCVIGSPSLTHLDFSFNLIHSWQGPVFGVSNITHLDLSENYCKNVSNYFFDDFTGLVKLNVSFNFLGPALHPINNRSYDTFKTLSKVRMLDLSYNKICKLDSKIFHNLTDLQYLYLSGNMMEDWTPSLENSHCLRHLDLFMNKFTTIPESLRNHLDSIKQNQLSQCNYTGNVTINMAGNPVECSCDSIPLMKWMVNSKVVVLFRKEDECHLPGGARRFLEHEHVMSEIVQILEQDCLSYSTFIIISVVIFTSFTTIVACVLLYRNRWRLRHWYYSKSRRHKHRGFEPLFENDAFISYTESDASFIKNKLVPALEDVHELRLWVADRDSTPGATIAANVTHAIYSSKKSVLLITYKYLRDKWCDYEMNMAMVESVESKRKLMILVLYEDIPAKHMPLDVVRLLRSEVCLEYPTHPQDMDTFWSSLADAIVAE